MRDPEAVQASHFTFLVVAYRLTIFRPIRTDRAAIPALFVSLTAHGSHHNKRVSLHLWSADNCHVPKAKQTEFQCSEDTDSKSFNG